MLTVGFELEFGNLARTAEVTAARYTGKPLADRPSWVLRTDSSCGDDPLAHGFEVNSPVIGTASRLVGDLSFICAWMSQMDATVNQRCGFHIHIGGFPCADCLTAVVKFMCRYERAFHALVSAERKDNLYCAPIAENVRDNLSRIRNVGVPATLSGVWDSRRYWLNTKSLVNHGTLELRLPEGTTDIERITGWIHLYLVCCEGVIAKYRKNPKKSVRNPALSSTDDPAMLVHDMLTSAGTYGAMAKEKGGWGDAALARKFAASRFKEIHGVSYRTVVDKMTRVRAKFKASKAAYEHEANAEANAEAQRRLAVCDTAANREYDWDTVPM